MWSHVQWRLKWFVYSRKKGGYIDEHTRSGLAPFFKSADLDDSIMGGGSQ